MDWLSQPALWVFAATYVCIASNQVPGVNINRTTAAAIGAGLMCLVGGLGLDEAWAAINKETIVLLLGMMILNVFLDECGFFEWFAEFVLARATSPLRMLMELAVLSGATSALFLNDTVCLMLTPPLLIILQRSGLPPLPFLLTLAMSANVGSVVTLTGNPQNMLIGDYSGWTYLPFFIRMLPVGLVGMVLMMIVLYGRYRHQFRDYVPLDQVVAAPLVTTDMLLQRRRLWTKTMVVMSGVLVGFMATSKLPWVAISGALVLMLWSWMSPVRVLKQVNWGLLVFFSGLFIVVRGVEKTQLVAELAVAARSWYGDGLTTQVPVFSTLTVVASNLVSNVPFVILAKDFLNGLQNPPLMWLVLAMASTFAGNLTIPGSVATLIVLEASKGSGTIGYFEFLRVGLPVTVLTVFAGALLLVLIAG